MNKKILCSAFALQAAGQKVVDKILFAREGVNQQETLLSDSTNYNDNKGSSETTRDITYNFDEYSVLIPPLLLPLASLRGGEGGGATKRK